MALRHWLYGIGGTSTAALIGIGIYYLATGPQVVEQRFTGSEVISIDIGTRVQERKHYDPIVLLCEGKDNCFPKDEFLDRLESRLDKLEANALNEARLR